MIHLALLTLLSQNPATLSGSPVRALSAVIDYDVALFLSAPSSECTGAAVTMDTGAAVTFVRASTRYCTKADGTMVLLSSGQPSVNASGLNIEGAKTNLVVRSQELDNVAWTGTNASCTGDTTAAPDGTTTAETCTSTVNGGLMDSATFTGTTGGGSSIYVKTTSGTQAFRLVVRDVTAGADKGACDQTATTTWTRFGCRGAAMTSGNNHTVRLMPGGAAGTGTVVAWGAQYETSNGFIPSSYIPTTNASVTRPNEVASFLTPALFSGSGCISGIVTYNTVTSSGTFSHAAGAAAGTASSTEKLLASFSSTTFGSNDSTNTVTATVTALNGRTIVARSSWSGATLAVLADGVSASGSFDGAWTGSVGATVYVGCTNGNANFLNGSVRSLRLGSNSAGCLQ